MKTVIVSYSRTGNNKQLSENVAKALHAELITVTEAKQRTVGKIMADMIFKRTPKTDPGTDVLSGADAVILAGPVWIREVAAPLRAYMKRLRTMQCPYAFLSISGGALGPNSRLAAELSRRTGRKPAALVDLHIADLLPKDKAVERKDTSAYHITAADVEKLTQTAVQELQDFATEE